MVRLYSGNARSFLLLYLCWILLDALTSIFSELMYGSVNSQPLAIFLRKAVTINLAQFILFYVLAYVVLPGYFRQRKFRRLLLKVVITLVLFSPVLMLGHVLSNPDLKEVITNTSGGQFGLIKRLSLYFLMGINAAILATAYRFVLEWLVVEKRKLLLQKENITMQLSFLKSQVNSHFLFNTLNNIYSLSLRNSVHTSGAILKLSEMLRYMLYEKMDGDKKVLLQHEISYLKNFIDLHQLTTNCSQCVSFSVEGNTEGARIAPLLLVPFIENAFKHGKTTDPANPVGIILVVNEGKLLFRVTNTKSFLNKDPHGGIGLDNVKNRLALEYSGRHELSITDLPQTFTAQLMIVLDDSQKLQQHV